MNQRDRFEAFAIRRNMGAERISCGRYKSSFTQAMFESWQAAEAAAIERCAKAVRSEELCDAGDTADDIAYNHAIDHAEKAIRALLPKEE